MDFYTLSDETTPLQILGAVKNVLEGEVTVSNVQEISLKDVPFGLGAMRGEDETQYGDGMVFSSQGYLTVLQEGKERLITHAKTIHTPFFMGLGNEAKPHERVTFSLSTPMTVEALYQELQKRTSCGLAVVGLVNFSLLHGVYLKRSPIYHESINDNRERYWLSEEVKECSGCLFGVIITEEGRKRFPPEKLARAFYTNPNDKVSTVMSHSHLLRQGDPSGEEKVNHLLNDSQLSAGTLYLYSLSP